MNILAAILRFYREWAWFFWIVAWWIAVFITMFFIGEADAASGSAERRMKTDQQIAGIVARVAWGAFGDVFDTKQTGLGSSGKGLGVLRNALGTATLTIDGESRSGWRAWTAAVWRVVRYASDAGADGTGNGSVCYSYRLHVRGYDVRRSTRIENGHVLLTTDAWWVERVPVGRSTREIPIHVVITIDASENGDGTTTLQGRATGFANTSDFRCGLVRRIAERQASETLDRELDRCLLGIQRRGTDHYHGADRYTDLLDYIGEAMRGVGPRLVRRR